MSSKTREKSTWWLIQNAKLTAVSPSLDVSKDHDDDPGWLTTFQERLRTSRLCGLMDESLLYAPDYILRLTFDEGSQRTIAFGLAPPKLINACRVLIDGQERVVMSPGLPEYDRITNRCQTIDLPTVRSNSSFPLGCGFLLSLIIYFIYLMLR